MASKETVEPRANGLTVQEEDDSALGHPNDAAEYRHAPATTETDRAQSLVAQKTKDLTTYTLDFLSHASNETLGACFVALGATTYLVLGRIGLVLIGVAVGVVLHAIWDNDSSSEKSEEDRKLDSSKRREKGLDIVHRILESRDKTKNGASRGSEDSYDEGSLRQKEVDFSGFPPETKEAITGFIDAVIQDYVRWWYGPILPKDMTFPSICHHTLARFLLMVSNQLARKRPADTFLDFLTNSSSIIIVFLSELSNAIKAAPGVEPVEAIHQHVFENPEGSLANVLDQEQQEKKLKSISDDILQNFLDATIYSCDPIKIFLQQILSGLVLESTIIKCARPEFINEWIIYALEDEQKSELVQAIDAGVSSATANGSTARDNSSMKPSDSFDGDSKVTTEHKRTVSRAEDAMEEAMQEAKRLSALIASEEANKAQSSEGDFSRGPITVNNIQPTSSQTELDSDTIASIPVSPPEDEPATLPSQAPDSSPSFTTFDQIISSKPKALQSTAPRTAAAPTVMTLHNATVSIFDDAIPGEKTTIKAKPTVEYLLQIEPASSQHPGWMIARRYPDFENMHEILRRIAVISGVTAFTQRNQTLPNWKNKTKATLRVELEAYLRDALSFDRLAESEGMKRFLEKDQGLDGTSPGTTSKGSFGFPSPAAFETVGKGMLDVLTSAPKGVAGGGKAVVGGVAGVFGGMGQKKQSLSSPMGRGATARDTSTTALPQMDNNDMPASLRSSEEKPHIERPKGSQIPSFETRDSAKPPLPPRPGDEILAQMAPDSSHDSAIDQNSTDRSLRTPEPEEPEIRLPPPPSEIEDDYKMRSSSTEPSLNGSTTFRTPTSSTLQSSMTLPLDATSPPKPRKADFTPLTIQETSVAVELFFATINELYGLSSAWTLRLTLLNAAKSFLLRPGNPNLEAIRQLLQTTVIESQITDEAIATQIRKTRENALPTEEELKAWPPLPTDEEKERMRLKARKLLVEKGMPAALTSVMGAAASREALGRVFDCLQVNEVARGLVFALVLQAVRAVTQ